MSEQAAGWYNDPYGRFQQRYWNGAAWSEHVATNGVQQVDPMGASTVIPFAIPPTAYTTPTDPEANTTQSVATLGEEPVEPASKVTTFLDGLGPDAKERPRPGLRTAMAGLGGAVIAFGVLTATQGEEPKRGIFIGVSLALIVASWALRSFAKLEEAKAAAVGIVVVAIATFAVALTVDDGQGGFVTGLIAAALFIAAWALPGFKSRNLLLGLGALALVGAFGALSADDNSNGEIEKCDQYLEVGDYDSFDAQCEGVYDDAFSSGFLPLGLTENLGTQGIIYLGGAGMFLGLTWWLDRRGYRGTATGLCAAGLASAVVGTGLLANEFGDTSGPILVLIVGLIICIVGTHGERRATTWWGAALAAIGIVSLVAIQMEPDSAAATGTAALISGLVLVAIAALSTPIRAAIRNQQSNDEQAAPPSSFAPPTQ